MNTKTLSLLSILLLSVTFLSPDVKNPDKPLKGDWDLQLKEVMRIDNPGADVLVKPRHLVVSDDGTIYLYDEQLLKFYLFSKEGKFVKTFAPKGEGPGELKRFYNAFLVNDKLIVVDAYEIEYFTKDATFIRKVTNDFSVRLPNYFINEDEFIYFPLLKTNDPDMAGKIFRFNIKTGKEKVLADFEIYGGGVVKSEEVVVGVIVPGLTPMMVVRYTPDRIYYGRNDIYKIISADHNGQKLNAFSVDRKKRKVTEADIKEFFKGKPIPPDMLPKIISSVPDDLTYFSIIQLHHSLLYVFNANLKRNIKSQRVDIFSPEGQYLYRTIIRPPKGFNITSGWVPLVIIKGNHLYMALVGDDGKATVGKYQITLPRS